MLKKLFIIIWFGKYPEWLNEWVANMEELKPYGYDYLIVSNLELFKQRVRNKLGIEPNIESGTGKPWDYRPLIGLLFEEELKGYYFWGHTDFDVVYGDVDSFLPDNYLRDIDIYANHYDYISGPFTLYRNSERLRYLFNRVPNWQDLVLDPTPNGWAEKEFTKVVDEHHDQEKIVRHYKYLQGKNPKDDSNLRKKNGKLFDGDEEIMMFHFRHIKKWPTTLTT